MTLSAVHSDSRLRVVLLTSSLERGGAERQVVELANALDPAMFDARVCSLSTNNPLAADLRDAKDRLIVLLKKRKYDLPLILKTAKMLSSFRAAVVHSFMFDAEIVGRLAGRLSRVPAVICSNRCPHIGRGKFKRWVSRATDSCFDVMIANSWAGLEYERDEQHVDPAKLCVVPNGIDVHRFTPGRADALRNELQIPTDAVVVGMFAHFRGNKDHATLIDAANAIIQNRRDVYFLLVGGSDGDGPDTLHGRCRAAVERYGIADRVIFTGHRSDVTQLYKALDIKVLSTHFEGTPNVVLEAMATGLPVVASDVCDNRRIVLDGVTGFVVPPKDAKAIADRIGRLIADVELRRTMGIAARERAVSEYAVAALGRRTADVYLSVLRQNGYFHGATAELKTAGGEA